MILSEAFLDYTVQNKLVFEGSKVLLAVSGGVDSMVLCDLFRQSSFSFAIAHCNFQLRGSDADADEYFVKSYAERNGIDFFSTRLATAKFAKQQGVSIQMAARTLRYDWFELLCFENGFHRIATAHHLNDSIETVLINLIKGTGISGLHGILPRQGRIIRPILFATRKQVEDYAATNQIVFREDVSNLSLNYLRNRIRHRIVPEMKRCNPALEQSFASSIQNFREAEELYRYAINRYKKKLLEKRGNEWYIPIRKLRQYRPIMTTLFELLRPFGFNVAQIEQLPEMMVGESGRFLLSPTHRLIKDRNFLIVAQQQSPTSGYRLIHRGEKEVSLNQHSLRIEERCVDEKFCIRRNPEVACLDMKALEFPLVMRRWKKGDYFYPFGLMKKKLNKPGKKKLGRFFIDLKMPLHEKDNVWVLLSGNRICWVVGLRIDHRFRVTTKTKMVLQLTVRP